MITFTITSFILTVFTIIVAGVAYGSWLILSEEEREKKKKEKEKKK